MALRVTREVEKNQLGTLMRRPEAGCNCWPVGCVTSTTATINFSAGVAWYFRLIGGFFLARPRGVRKMEFASLGGQGFLSGLVHESVPFVVSFAGMQSGG